MEHTPIILSILVCHLDDREQELIHLIESLQKQCINKPVEILIESDCGEKTVGAKRNRLLNLSKGEYVAFVDDDDEVSSDYVSSILDAIKSKPDCVGIEGIMRGEGYPPQLFRHSIQFQCHYTGTDAFYRTPNHLNPIKRTIARRIMFREIDYGEDKNFSEYVKFHLKTEVYISHPVYYYNKPLTEIRNEQIKHQGKTLGEQQ